MYIGVEFSGMDASGYNFNFVPNNNEKKMCDATVRLIFARTRIGTRVYSVYRYLNNKCIDTKNIL